MKTAEEGGLHIFDTDILNIFFFFPIAEITTQPMGKISVYIAYTHCGLVNVYGQYSNSISQLQAYHTTDTNYKTQTHFTVFTCS